MRLLDWVRRRDRERAATARVEEARCRRRETNQLASAARQEVTALRRTLAAGDDEFLESVIFPRHTTSRPVAPRGTVRKEQ